MATNAEPSEALDFTVDVREQDGTTVVELSGELDLATADAMQETLASPTVTDAPMVRVDLSRVTFIDSCSIGLLAIACNRIRGAGGKFAVTCGGSTTRRVLEISGLVEFFEVDGVPA